MQLNEDFLHYIWQYRLLTSLDTYCKDGAELRIIDQGERNSNAGPDFSLAKVKIGSQLWVGNIEIHVKSSDWLLHGHQSDVLYDSVILHAIYEDDGDICRTDGTLIPVLVLRDLIPERLFTNYLHLIAAKNFFPCAKQVSSVQKQVKDQLLQQMVQERFIEKAKEVAVKMSQNKNDWNGTFYYLLMRNFGFKINSVPFEILSDSVSSTILSRHRDNPLQVEALLFGQAGFLKSDFKDDYPKQLQVEYQFLQKKYGLKNGDPSVWKFLRIHPQNFPILRIAQVAALIVGHWDIFTNLLQQPDIAAIKRLFSFARVHPYWSNHSHFDKTCKTHSLVFGKQSIDNLIINTVCLLWYCYGDYLSQDDFKERALNLLKTIPAERNATLMNYVKAGFIPRNAYDSQALLQLYKTKCAPKKCLDCNIGRSLIGRGE